MATRGRIRTGAGAPLRQLTTALKECDRAALLITKARKRVETCTEAMRKMRERETKGTGGAGRGGEGERRAA